MALNRKARRAQGARERRAISPVPLNAGQGEPCGCGEEFPVDVTHGSCGPYTWGVAGQPGCFWLWWVEDQGETIAEGEEDTREAAMWAAEANARAFVSIDQGGGLPGVPGRH